MAELLDRFTKGLKGYNLGGRVRNAGLFLATGKVPEDVDSDEALMKRMLLQQRLQTGNPAFQMKLAQTKADMELANTLEAEEAKVTAARNRAMAAMGGQANGSSVGVAEPVPMPLNQQNSPLGQMGGNKVPQFLQVELPPKYDPATGMMMPQYDMKPNTDYLSPDKLIELEEKKKQQAAADDLSRTQAQDTLNSIREIKKGSRFFGPLGNLPTLAAPSSIPIPIIGDKMGANQYEERKMWENNINQLLSKKVVELMSEMKRVSSTGATGFGNMSNKDLATLREASTALSKDLAPEQALYYLNEMEKINKKFLGMPIEDGGNNVVPTNTSVAPKQIGRFKVTVNG